MNNHSRRPLTGLVSSSGSWQRRPDETAPPWSESDYRARIPLPAPWLRLASSCALILLLVAPAWSWGFEIKQAGKIQVPPEAQLFAFSTDPTIQQTLSQDFSAASRSSFKTPASTVTVSVNVTQQMLRPGISLAQLAPGDPQVADLMRAAGANPPPLGDTGNQYDEAALARRIAARDYLPNDTQSERLINSTSNPGSFTAGFGPPIPMPCSAQSVARPGCPPVPQSTAAATPDRSLGDVQGYLQRRKQTQGLFNSGENDDYDTVIVARASVSGAPEEMTLVAVTHPGEDLNDAKKHIAERIANSILR